MNFVGVPQIKHMKHRYVTLFFFAFFTICSIALKAQSASDDRVGSTFPAFSLPSVDGKIITHYDLPLNKPVIVFYFDPGCEHCQQEGEWINESKKELENVTIVFVAYAEAGAVAEYRDKYVGGGDSNMFFLMDPKFQFDKIFGYSESPTIHIYNAQWVKTKVFRNEIAIEEILNVIK